MASKIKIKRSSVAGRVPTTSDIDVGELAINTKDQKLYSSNGSAVFQLAYVSDGAVTITTATVKNLTQNDTVVTNVASYANSVVDAAGLAAKANATNPTTSGVLAHTGRATISTNLTVSGNTAVVGLKANNSLGTSGQFLRSDGSKAYWDALPPSTQYLQVSNAAAIYATKSNPTTSGLLAHTGRATISTNLTVSGNTTIVGLNANNTLGTTGQVLKTNGTSVYWGTGGGAAGANATVTRAKVSDLNVNSYVITSVTGAYVNANNMVSLTTKSFDALRGTDTVVTGVQTLAATNYLQVANAKSQLANTNSSIATQATRITLVNTNLLSTNTAIRTYVDTKVAGIVNSAPSTLDTLKELATALNNDVSFSTTVTNLIGTKISVANAAATYATKASPTTSGLLAHTGRATVSTNLAVSGNTSLGGLVNITYTGSANASLAIRGTNTKGGSGYHDFLVVRNGGGGATNPNKWFRTNVTGGLEIINDAYTSVLFSLSDVGDLVTSGNVTAYSDEKLKTNITTIEGALALVEQMRGVRYNRIQDGKAGIGVVAQEMQQVLPEVVLEGDNLSVAYGNLVGVLIEAVKELSARVKELEAK